MGADQSPQDLRSTILNLIPQQEPFRYIDRIVEVDHEHIQGEYTFKKDEWFYPGHFPDQAITPGVILIETLAQTGVVAFGIYLALQETLETLPAGHKLTPENLKEITSRRTVFTSVNADFMKKVYPGDHVTIKAKKVFWRRKKLKTFAEMYLDDGSLVATAELSGIGEMISAK